MLVHSVFFWLDPELSEEQTVKFEAGLRTLLEIPGIRHGFVGKPAGTKRPAVDRTYDFGLTIVFDDLAGHDAYQPHPIHQAFVAANSPLWIKVVIYDVA